MKIKNFEGYEIRSVHEQKHTSRWGALKNNQYRIFIKNLATGKTCSFRYWNSNTVYCPIKDLDELISAVDCFCGDAISSTYSFKEFCNEFGYDIYDEDDYGYNKKVKSIYAACKRAYQSAIRVFGSEDELYRVGNICRDVENGDYAKEIA